MAWRDALRSGSFRGVPFQIDSHDLTFGRRTSMHEYPLRDEPYSEDLGRKARVFSLNLYVIGRDYMAGRDNLREALEKTGARPAGAPLPGHAHGPGRRGQAERILV
jgi:prophage DNA circulation protein